MARSKAGDAAIGRVSRASRANRNTTGPLQASPSLNGASNRVASRYDFLDLKHRVFVAWFDRWSANESRLAGGDDVINELRPFEWETDMTTDGFYYKRKQEAVYTNFPDIFAAAITGHLLKFSPKPDSGWAVPNLGKVTGKTIRPTQAEQVWYSVDNPSGAGTEWNQYWSDVAKRAMATGHRWMYVDSTTEAAKTRDREFLGFRPYLTEFSPCDVPNWFINERDVLEFVVIRIPDEGPRVVDGKIEQPTDVMQRGYLLLVREGCTRLGTEFVGGGWWKFSGEKVRLDAAPWTDTKGEIPVALLYYQRHKGTPTMPAISRPGLTELGQAAIAGMNMMSSANFNAWEAGGGVDYLNGIDEDAFAEVERLAKLGSRRIPLPPNAETDTVPTVSPSSLGAVQSDVFNMREKAIWDAAVRLGVIEVAGQVGGSGNGSSGVTAEATFSAAQGPRIVSFAQNLSVCQNNVIRYFELRYGHPNPSGLVNWPSKFDLTPLVDKIRSFFETERLSGIRSKTMDADAMVMAAEEKGLIIDPGSKEKIHAEYMANAEVVLKIQANQADPTATGVVGKPVATATAKSQSDRLALQKAQRTRGKAGTNQGRGPKQRPTTPPKPSNRT